MVAARACGPGDYIAERADVFGTRAGGFADEHVGDRREGAQASRIEFLSASEKGEGVRFIDPGV